MIFKSYNTKLINLNDINLSEEVAAQAIENYMESHKNNNVPMLGEMAEKNTTYKNYTTVNLDNVCIEYKNLYVKDGYIWGEYTPTNNGPGTMIQCILDLYGKEPSVEPIFAIRMVEYKGEDKTIIPRIISIDLLAFKGLAMK